MGFNFLEHKAECEKERISRKDIAREHEHQEPKLSRKNYYDAKGSEHWDYIFERGE